MDRTSAKNTLNHYYEHAGSYIDYQDGGTTLVMLGCVLLASILTGTQSPDELATLTGLPIGFVTAALIVISAGGHYFSLRLDDLIVAAHNPSLDVSIVEEILADLLVEVCEGTDRHWIEILGSLRVGHIYGGDLQPWTTEEAELINAPAPAPPIDDRGPRFKRAPVRHGDKTTVGNPTRQPGIQSGT
jgi:hypothetical protein